MLPFSPGGRKKTTNSKSTVSSPKTVGNLLPPLEEALKTVRAHLDKNGLSQELVDLYRAIQVKMNEPTGSKELSPSEQIKIPRPSKLMQQNDNSRLMLKNPELLLSFGLECVGFDKKRQSSVRSSLNIDRFTGHYGTGPKTVQAMLKDLASHYPHIAIKNVLMTLYWLKTYVTQHVMSGTWGHSEDFIGKTVKEYTKLIQSLKSKKIVFGGFDDREIFWVSVDKVNFLVEEFRLDPSTKWYDFKSKSSGLTYEFAMAINRPAIVWHRGGFPASEHDITVFRGGKKKDGVEKWDKKALYFNIPDGKRAVGDSGYAGEPHKVTTAKYHQSRELKEWLGRVKNRQETLHTRLKSYGALKNRFRHGKTGTQNKIDEHTAVVEAVLVMTQYDFENGHPPFSVPPLPSS